MTIGQDYTPFPVAALVDITSNCNLNCPYCIDRYALRRGELPTERLLMLLDELKEVGIRSIVYFGGGEPLVHPGVSQVLLKTRQLDIDLAVNTNGVLLEKYLDIIGETSSWTRISVDAGTREVYNRVHRLESGNLFDRIIRSVERLATQAKGTVGLSFVLMQENIEDIYTAAKVAKSSGCDFVQFKPMYGTTEDKKYLQYFDDAENIRIGRQLTQARALVDSDFAVLTTGSLETLLERRPINQNKTYTVCAAQQLVTLINPDGVYLCPNYRGVNTKRVGDIKTSTFQEVWLSEHRREVVCSVDPSRECNFFCLRQLVNVMVNTISDAKRQGLSLERYLVQFADDAITDRFFL